MDAQETGVKAKLLKQFTLKSQPQRMMISKNAQYIAIYNAGQCIYLINTSQMDMSVLEFVDINCFNFTSDCQLLLCQQGKHLIKIDLKQKKVIEELKGFNHPSKFMEISENNNLVALIANDRIYLYKNRNLHLSESYFECDVSGAVFSPDCNQLVVGYVNTWLVIVNIATKTNVHQFQLTSQNCIKSLAVSCKLNLIAIAGNNKVFLFSSSKLENIKDAVSQIPFDAQLENGDLVFSQNDDFIIFSGGRSLKVLDPINQKGQIVKYDYQFSKDPCDRKIFTTNPSKPNTMIGIESNKCQINLIELYWAPVK